MSEDKKIPVIDKRTGGVSNLQSAKDAMTPKPKVMQNLVDDRPVEETQDKQEQLPEKQEIVTSLVTYFDFAYSKGGQVITVKAQEIEKKRNVPKNFEVTQADIQRILLLSMEDPTLKVPRLILHSLKPLCANAGLRSQLVKLISLVVKENQLVRGLGLDSLLSPEIEHEKLLLVLKTLATKPHDQVKDLKAPGVQKPKEWAEFSVNLAWVFVMMPWIEPSKDITDADIQELMFSEYFAKLTFPGNKDSLLSTMMLKDVESALIYGQVYSNKVNGLVLEKMALKEQIDNKNQQLANEKQLVNQLEEEVATVTGTQAKLQEELNSEREQHQHSKTHSVDDHVTLKSSFIRLIDSEIELLSKGLNALRKEKPHIMDDHAERVIDSLQKYRKRLLED